MKAFDKYIGEKLKIGSNFEYDENDFSYYFKTEEGRAKITELCLPYIHSIVNTYKTEFDPDDLFCSACLGFVVAMNEYNPKRNDDFLKVCQYRIKEEIHRYIMDYSRTVRVPRTSQDEISAYKPQYNLSIDELIDKNNNINDDSNTKMDTRIMDDVPKYTETNINDFEMITRAIEEKIRTKFPRKQAEIFLSYYGFRGNKKMKNTELAKKYNCVASNISYYILQIKKFLNENAKQELIRLRDFINDFEQ